VKAGVTVAALLSALVIVACSDAQKPAQGLTDVELVVHADGSLELGGEHLNNHQEFSRRLRLLTVNGSELRVHIQADKTASYDTVADVLRIAQASHAVRVGIVGTEQPD
jgi:biopolymer transport protein ExbD